MLSLGHLSPSIVTLSHLREISKDTNRTTSSFMVEPTEALWKYYSPLGCVMFLEDDKLLVFISVP